LFSNSFYSLEEFFKRWLYYFCQNWVVLIMLLYWMILFICSSEWMYCSYCHAVLSYVSITRVLFMFILK
jgi:hypothetical protein